MAAYLPNTARLHDLLLPGAPLLLKPATDPRRATGYTVTRVSDGPTLVALDAAGAADVLAEHVRRSGSFPGAAEVEGVEREVRIGRRRIDLRLRPHAAEHLLVEVKSLSRAVGRDAPLSATPSTRGVAHLEVLAELARDAQRTAVVFVVQRGDVDRLVVGPYADRGWVAAVRAAHAAGVEIVAFRCAVHPTSVAVDRPLPIVW